MKTVCIVARRSPDPSAIGSKGDRDTATCRGAPQSQPTWNLTLNGAALTVPPTPQLFSDDGHLMGRGWHAIHRKRRAGRALLDIGRPQDRELVLVIGKPMRS